MLDLFTLPCTPYAMPGTSAFVSLCSALRIISEVKAPETVDAILVRLKSSLEATKSIWSGFSSEAKTKDLVTICMSLPQSDRCSILTRSLAPETVEEKNRSFRSLSELLTFIALLGDVYSNLSYAHGRVASTVLLALCNPTETEILLNLGDVYRFSVWEALMLNKIQAPARVAETDGVTVAGSEVKDVLETISTVSVASSHAPNVKSLHEIITSLPLHIVPFFQCEHFSEFCSIFADSDFDSAVIKLFVHRRISELPSHRKASAHLAKTIAVILVENLKWPDSTDTVSQLTYSSNMMSNVDALVLDGTFLTLKSGSG